MPLETHACGLTKYVTEHDEAATGLLYSGSAGPVWSLACALLSFMLVSGAARRPELVAKPSHAAPAHDLNPALASTSH